MATIRSGAPADLSSASPGRPTFPWLLALAIGLVIWIARTLFKTGAVFLEDVFSENHKLAEAVNRLLVVGFYLVNLGYASFILKAFGATTVTEAIEVLAGKLLLPDHRLHRDGHHLGLVGGEMKVEIRLYQIAPNLQPRRVGTELDPAHPADAILAEVGELDGPALGSRGVVMSPAGPGQPADLEDVREVRTERQVDRSRAHAQSPRCSRPSRRRKCLCRRNHFHEHRVHVLEYTDTTHPFDEEGAMPSARKLSLRGEDRDEEYFHVLCVRCGDHVDVTFLGIIAHVPYLEVQCRRCGDRAKRKLVAAHWHALPAKPA